MNSVMKHVVVPLAVAFAWTAPAVGGEATLVLQLPDATPDAIHPQVLDAETGRVLDNSIDSKDWIYQLEFGEGQIIKRLRLSVVGPQNTQWLFTELLMDHPFFREGALRVVLAPPTDVGVGSDAVRALWGTSVKNMSSDQLLEFYQRARHVAQHRMNKLEGQWYQTHPYDVQSVFKYLESVLALSKQLYILPPEDVSKGRDWLNDAIANAPDVVDKAVKLANANQLVQGVDSEEGSRFGSLWKAIKSIEPCEKRKKYLEAYRTWFLKVDSDQRRERIVDVTHVPLPVVESAVAQCVATQAQKAVLTGTDEDKEAAKAELSQQIDSLERVRADTQLPKWSKKLDSDISSLNNILSAF
jgi:hypothetical protein